MPALSSGLARAVAGAWPKLVVAATVGAVAGLALALRVPTTSTATTDLFVRATIGSTATELNRGRVAAERATASMSAVATSSDVLDPVIDSLGLGTTASALAGRITVDAPAGEQLVSISVSDHDPARAREIAAAVARSSSDQLSKLSARTADGSAALAATILGTSVEPPTRPGPAVPMTLAATLAVLAALAHTVGRYLRDERVRDRDDLAALTSAPLLGTITATARHQRPTPADRSCLLGPVVTGWLEHADGSTVFLADTRGSRASRHTADWLRAWSAERPAGAGLLVVDDARTDAAHREAERFDASPFRAMVIGADSATHRDREAWTALLTVDRRRARLADVERAIAFLEFRGFGLLGIVLTDRRRREVVRPLRESLAHPWKLVSVRS